ncbi:MAG TPA: dihydrolipoamide acetyltransferase family protein [Solirubrobacteraceae bacterium]|nr:dihydrolipoamide acetyltransferase family protein [Solirubrobacteraceae bacterium]
MATEIVMPRLSDSMEEGTVLQWFVSVGDRVAEGEPLVEVETDKASVTYESEVDGTLLAIQAEAGASIAVGAVMALVGQAGEEVAAPAGAAQAPASDHAPDRSPAGSPESSGRGSSASPAQLRDRPAPASGRAKASPLARRIAAQLDVDLSSLAGSGPQGRVLRADVERAAAGGEVGTTGPGSAGSGRRPASNGATEISASPSGAGGDGPGTGRPSGAPPASKGQGSRRPLTRMQQTIARRMAQSRATVPDFELRAEIDMTELVALREQLRATAAAVPSYNDFIVKAAAFALREFPRVNGSYLDGAIEEHPRINIGIAVAGEDSLVVPTIFDADRKSVGEIAAQSRQLAASVRDGSITPAELSGGTFSVSNLGMYGIDSFSAVVNAPQAAILAVGSLRLRPAVAADGSIVARQTMHVSLACDHRILYGADGARFLRRLVELLEQPLGLLI